MQTKLLTIVLLSSILEKVLCNELILVQVLYRHAVRAPAAFYPNDFHKKDWPMGKGQLTNVGKQNEYELGRFIKKRYIDDQKFLNKTFDPKYIYVRSTDVDRTLESAELVLAALYPPNARTNWNKTLLWQPIPVHTVPRIEDNLLQYKGTYCPQFWKEYSDSLKVDPMKSFLKKYKKLFDFVSSKSGMKVDINNLWIVYDDTFNEKLHNMSTPQWVDKIWPELQKQSNENFGLFVPTTSTKRLKGGPLVKKMLENCDLRIKNKSPIRMYQYSAHDTTLGIWFSALGIYNGIHPPYSSAAMFELYKLDNSSDDAYAIKILYRNNTKTDPYTLVVPGCTELCPLNKFKELTTAIIPKNIAEECKGASPKPQTKSPSKPQTKSPHKGNATDNSAKLFLVFVSSLLLFVFNN